MITGVFSRKAFERLGFTVAAEMFYSEYTDRNGVKVFEVAGMEKMR